MSELLAAGMPWQIFNFVVFLVVLFFALRKPVKEFWASRSHQIRFDMEEAERLRREASERHGALQSRLSRIEKEISELIRSLEDEGEMEKKVMTQEAEKLSQKIKQDTERIAAQEVRKARETLKVQAVQLSVEMAERLIRENVRESDQRRLSENYLKELEEKRA